MMTFRLNKWTQISKVALLFPSFLNSTLRFSTTLFHNSSVKGGGTFLNANSSTRQGAISAKPSRQRKITNHGFIWKYRKDNSLRRCYSSHNREVPFSPLTKNNSSTIGGLQQVGTSTSRMSNICSNQSELGKECASTPQRDPLSDPMLQQDNELLYNTGSTDMLEKYSLPTSFGKKHEPYRRNEEKYPKKCTTPEPFDIYQSETDGYETSDSETDGVEFLRSSLDVDNSSENSEVDGLIEGPLGKILRPGMVLLKECISPAEQVSITEKCRELGLGPGGFYHPSFKGGKMRLRMMCLGMDWDPETRKYQKRRRIDKAKAPDIPYEFHLLVTRAMKDSLSLIREAFNVHNAEKILPQMTPDICIVNFYSDTGKLGLHQDRDESKESLAEGLPVVSFSIGDSAEFLYGDERDANKAEKVVLESGDALVFGGQSRHVFHGISSIIPDSAPRFLVEHPRLLRPGRLNLTFRQH